MPLQGADQIEEAQARGHQQFDEARQASVSGEAAGQARAQGHHRRRGLATGAVGDERRHRQILLFAGQVGDGLAQAQQSRLVTGVQGADEVHHRDMGAGAHQQADGAFPHQFGAVRQQHGHQLAHHRQGRHGVAELLQRRSALVIGPGGKEALHRGAQGRGEGADHLDHRRRRRRGGGEEGIAEFVIEGDDAPAGIRPVSLAGADEAGHLHAMLGDEGGETVGGDILQAAVGEQVLALGIGEQGFERRSGDGEIGLEQGAEAQEDAGIAAAQALQERSIAGAQTLDHGPHLGLTGRGSRLQARPRQRLSAWDHRVAPSQWSHS